MFYIFKTWFIICFIFHRMPFISCFLSLSFQIIIIIIIIMMMFFINHALKFKDQPIYLKVSGIHLNFRLLRDKNWSSDCVTKASVSHLISCPVSPLHFLFLFITTCVISCVCYLAKSNEMPVFHSVLLLTKQLHTHFDVAVCSINC
jgi:hypothetical protein